MSKVLQRLPQKRARLALARSAVAVAFLAAVILAPVASVSSFCPMPCCKHSASQTMKVASGACQSECEVSSSPAPHTPIASVASSAAQPSLQNATVVVTSVAPASDASGKRFTNSDSDVGRAADSPLYILDAAFLI